MAQRSRMPPGDTELSAMERYFTLKLQRSELDTLQPFVKGGDLLDHIKRVEDKFLSISPSETEKIKLLLSTFDDNSRLELYSLPEYDKNKSSYSWVTTTLARLFGSARSRVETIVHFMDIRQEANQSVRDFLSLVRVKSLQIMGDADSETRENYALMAFINGLNCRKHAAALKQLKPGSLEQAYELVKDEVVIQEDTVNTMTAEPDVLKSLESKVNFLLREMEGLKRLLTDTSPKSSGPTDSYAQVVRRNGPPPLQVRRQFPPQSPRSTDHTEVTCFNCLQNGHYARYCNNTPKCSFCTANGHSFRDCRKRRQGEGMLPRNRTRRSLRHLAEDDDFITWEDETSPQPQPLSVADGVSVEETRGCGAISYFSDSTSHELAATETLEKVGVITSINEVCAIARPRTLQSKNYHKEVREWGDYIRGSGKVPAQPMKKESSTATAKDERLGDSMCNTNNTTNKPLVNAKVLNEEVQVLMDTGADTNTIDSYFVQLLQSRTPSLRVWRKRGSLKCANGSQVDVLGYVYLDVSLGHSIHRVKFSVVRGVSPKLIIGLRTMKAENINILPPHDCIEVNGNPISFISATTVPLN